MRKVVYLLGLIGVFVLVGAASIAVAAGASPSFSFSTDASGSTWKCQLDSGTAASCSSPQAYSNLAPGKHTVTLTASFEVDAVPVNTAAPAVSGTTQVGQTLSATNGTWTGYPTPTYSYQWQRCSTSCSNISGATSQTYVLQSTDTGDNVQAVVTASNSQGSASKASKPVGAVASSSGGDPVLLGQQTVEPTSDNNSDGSAQAWSYTASVSGTAMGVSFYVDTGNSGALVLGLYSDSNGTPGQLLGSASVSSPTAGQWNQATLSSSPSIVSGTKYWLAVLGTGGGAAHFRDNAAGGSCQTQASKQSNLTALPSTWTSGQSWTTYCPASFYVSGTANAAQQTAPLSAPVNTSAPAISGTAQQGDALTTSNGSWSNSPTSYSYAWQDCNSSGASCTTITGATASSYTLTSGDVGHTIRAVVTATNAGGSAAATSAASAAVSAASSGSSGCSGTTNTPGGADPWGGCFPGTNNTGVPAGTTLATIGASGTGWTFSGGGLNITSCGVTLNDMKIPGTVYLTASASNGTHSASTPCVTISNSEIDGWVDVGDTDGSQAGGPLVLTNDTVNVPNGDDDRSPVLAENYYATGLNVEGGRLGFSCRGYCTITNSYAHDGYLEGAFHYNAVGSNGLNGPLTLQHDSLACDFGNDNTTALNNGAGCSDDVGLFGDFNPISNVTINETLFASDAQSYGGVPYCFDGNNPNSGKTYPNATNEVVTNNVFEKGVPSSTNGTDQCGQYGPVYSWTSGNGNQWSGNTWDTGAALNEP